MSELTTLFKNTADAIRSKTGDTATMKASQFPAKIQGISVGISQDEADARYLQLSGGTMTGNLILNGAPTADNQAATKAYVDGKASGDIGVLIGSSPLSKPTTTVNILTTTLDAYTMLRCVLDGFTANDYIYLSIDGTTTYFQILRGVNPSFVIMRYPFAAFTAIYPTPVSGITWKKYQFPANGDYTQLVLTINTNQAVNGTLKIYGL